VKIRVGDLDTLAVRAKALGAEERGELRQVDTYFAAPQRLKLREMDGVAELIAYSRPDVSGLRTSDYTITPVTDPEALKAAHVVIARVAKMRRLLMLGRTRIHLDAVVGLGEFLELEVVLRDGDDERVGEHEAEEILQGLGVDGERIAGSYADYFLSTTPTSPK